MGAPLTICVFGTFDERLHPRIRVLREGLAAHGCRVEVCNVPLGIDTHERVRMAQTPWRAPVLLVRIVAAWAALLWRSRRIGRPDVVVVGYLGHFDVHLARRRFRGSTIVLDHLIGLADTAFDRRIGPDRTVTRVLAAVDRAAVGAADLVLCDTAEQAATLGLPPERTVVVPVGAHGAWFTAGDAALAALGDEPAGPLRVVFFGLFTPLQGAPVIGAAAALLHDRQVPCTFTLIGRGQDDAATFAAMGDAPHVERVDWVDADDLPGVVAGHDVCLGVFGTTPKASRVVPNKVYQGAAAGTVVVTGDTPCQRDALDGFGVLVPRGQPDALADALAELAADPRATRRARRATAAAARERFAPAVVVEPLLARLGAS
jgi:glycosyltransferase involved in cell wall biosynthesis